MAKKNNKKTENAELEKAVERDRRGKVPFTHREVLERLRRIRDGSIVWMEQCITEGTSKGAGTAQLLSEKASHEIERLELALDGEDKTNRKWEWCDHPGPPLEEEPTVN